MKTKTINTILQLSLIASVCGEGLRLPEVDPFIVDSINKAASVDSSDPESEAVSIGTIKSAYVSEIQNVKSLFAEQLAKAPEGQDGKGSQWYASVYDIDVGLDKVLKSRACSELLILIPKIAAILQRTESEAEPEFYLECASRIDSLGRAYVSSAAQTVKENGGAVDNALLLKIVTLFSVIGFMGEPDWEDEVMPIDPAGVFILDPVAVVNYLEAQPWQQADLFLRGNDSGTAFARYAATGDGMSVLRSRYGASQAIIVAKWNELASWVEQQRPADQ